MNAKKEVSGLEKLRLPFPPHQISKLPKETKAQIDQRKTDKSFMVFNCPVCGGHHHKNAVHLDYVGHAALTDRLLDTDPHWYWEPYVAEGLPNPGIGMWIKLHVCGHSHIGYGHADGKTGGDAIKEIIGDAMRNAGMRFGMALDLWHKGDLHIDDADAASEEMPDDEWAKLVQLVEASGADTIAMLKHFNVKSLRQLDQVQYASAIDMLNTKLAKKVRAETTSLAKELEDAIDF